MKDRSVYKKIGTDSAGINKLFLNEIVTFGPLIKLKTLHCLIKDLNIEENAGFV